MNQDQKREVSKRPGTGGEQDEATEFQDFASQIPKVDSLLSEIDELLKATEPQDRCRC